MGRAADGVSDMPHGYPRAWHVRQLRLDSFFHRLDRKAMQRTDDPHG
jgi:hypothetical protein